MFNLVKKMFKGAIAIQLAMSPVLANTTASDQAIEQLTQSKKTILDGIVRQYSDKLVIYDHNFKKRKIWEFESLNSSDFYFSFVGSLLITHIQITPLERGIKVSINGVQGDFKLLPNTAREMIISLDAAPQESLESFYQFMNAYQERASKAVGETIYGEVRAMSKPLCLIALFGAIAFRFHPNYTMFLERKIKMPLKFATPVLLLAAALGMAIWAENSAPRAL